MRKKLKQLMGILLSLVMVPVMSLTAYAEDSYTSLKNTTTIVYFDSKEWYLIDYDSDTVTLLSKECVGRSAFDSNGVSNEYSGSTVEAYVNNWYSEHISTNAKTAVYGDGAFLLTTGQAKALPQNIRECIQAGEDYSHWWLCSHGYYYDFYAASVDDGSVDVYGWHVINEFGVRPALKLNLSSVTFLSSSNTFWVGSAYRVIITPGSNMTKTADSGSESQAELTGPMTGVVYTADEDYYFPEDYSVAAVSGITVTRNDHTRITVSGTPTADAEITLTAPTAKTKPDAPMATAVNCTTADNSNGKLTGVTTDMEYKKSDADGWTAGTGSDITNLVPGTYYVRIRETDTTFASDNQELTIKGFISCTVTFKVVNGSWNEGEGNAATADKTVILTGNEGDTLKLAADQIPAVGTKPNDNYKAGNWNVTPSADTAITAATTYTYTYAAKEASVVTKAPETKTLTYNGEVQELVTAGTATGGSMYYALGTATTAPTTGYTTSIPTATDAGTYYVWYKVVGDATHTDSEPASVTAKISEVEEIEDEDEDEPAQTTSASSTTPRSPKTGDDLMSYSFWLILAVAGLAVSGMAAKGCRKEED